MARIPLRLSNGKPGGVLVLALAIGVSPVFPATLPASESFSPLEVGTEWVYRIGTDVPPAGYICGMPCAGSEALRTITVIDTVSKGDATAFVVQSRDTLRYCAANEYPDLPPNAENAVRTDSSGYAVWAYTVVDTCVEVNGKVVCTGLFQSSECGAPIFDSVAYHSGAVVSIPWDQDSVRATYRRYDYTSWSYWKELRAAGVGLVCHNRYSYFPGSHSSYREWAYLVSYNGVPVQAFTLLGYADELHATASRSRKRHSAVTGRVRVREVASGLFRIESTTSGEMLRCVRVYDSAGRLCGKGDLHDRREAYLELSALRAGRYVFSVAGTRGASHSVVLVGE